MRQGPNVKKLIVHKMSLLAIPAGSVNPGLVDALAFFTDPGRLESVAREATDWVGKVIALAGAVK